MFLLVVPRNNSDGTARDLSKYQRLVRSSVDSYRELQHRLSSAADQDHISVHAGQAILWLGPGAAHVQDGHRASVVSTDQQTAQGLLSSLKRSGGHLRYRKPVWGSYFALLTETQEQRFTAWRTLPSIHSLYYASTDTHLVLGSQPLLVALAAHQGHRRHLPLSRKYLMEYLYYGYAMTEQSPFEGVYSVSPSKAVTLQNGEVWVSSVPSGLTVELDDDISIHDGAEALREAMVGGMSRVLTQLGTRPLQVRVSGGADSRALLALLQGRDVQLRGVVYGSAADADVRIARRLCEISGIPLEIAAPSLMEGSDHAERVAAVIRASDGIPLSEPQGAIYAGAEVLQQGEGIMLGQWPLMKGGLARTMRTSVDRARRLVINQGADILAQDLRRPMDAFLASWMDTCGAASTLERLYLFSREFRSSRWMEGLIQQFRRDATICYPLVDSQVTAVADALPISHKVAHASYFLAMTALWPAITRIPMDKFWPFEVSGPHPQIDPDGRRLRQQGLDQYFGPGRPSVVEQAVELQPNSISYITSAVADSANASLFEDLLTEDFWQALLNWRSGNGTPHGQFNMTVTKRLLWRVFVADQWLHRAWLA